MATHSSILAWKNPMDRGVWRATAYGVAKSQTPLHDYTTTTVASHLFAVFTSSHVINLVSGKKRPVVLLFPNISTCHFPPTYHKPLTIFALEYTKFGA